MRTAWRVVASSGLSVAVFGIFQDKPDAEAFAVLLKQRGEDEVEVLDFQTPKATFNAMFLCS